MCGGEERSDADQSDEQEIVSMHLVVRCRRCVPSSPVLGSCVGGLRKSQITRSLSHFRRSEVGKRELTRRNDRKRDLTA